MHGLTRSISFAGTHLAQYQKKWRLDEKKKIKTYFAFGASKVCTVNEEGRVCKYFVNSANG